MPLYLMRARICADALPRPKSLQSLGRHVAERPSFDKLPAAPAHGEREQ